MSGEDVSGGGTSGGATGDEAAWQDLVAHYDMPGDWPDSTTPWPDRENLTTPGHDADDQGPGSQPPGASTPPGAGLRPDTNTRPGTSPGPGTGTPPGTSTPPGTGTPPATGTPPGASARPGTGTPPGASTRPDTSTRPGTATPPGTSARPGTGTPPGTSIRPGTSARPGFSADRTRVVRPANPPSFPAAWPPGGAGPDPGTSQGDDADELFVPPPPPPLPHLDSVAKGAWTALFGGPAYLLLATLVGWAVPGWAALAAITAFVAGFVVLVLRLGDGPSRGSGPDNGAVL